jgi:hypothetical protein
VKEIEVFEIVNSMDFQSGGEKYMNERLLSGIETDADGDTTFGNGLPCKRATLHRGRR